MPALVVVVCPPGPLTAVGDALADWAATNLLQTFLWVETSAWNSGAPPRGQTPALCVQGGRTTGTTVEQALTAYSFDRVRLIVLVPALAGAPGVSAETEHAIHQAILGTSAVQRVDLVRLVVTRPESGPVAADLAREGWHNLIIAPEESHGPRLGHSVLPATADPIDVAPAAAACLAGVAGLWRDLAAGPLDDRQAPFGRTLRLVRSWYRDLDATAVADRVRAGLLSLGDGVPLPRQHGSHAVYIDDSRRAAKDMADAVLGRHASLFVGERVAPAAVQAEKIGIWQAITMLFGFIAASIKMAPMKWYSLVLGDVGSAVASRVQRLAFGADPSQYAVVAQGSLAGGGADWRRVGQASAHLHQVLHQSGPRPHEITGDFSAVWEDYIESGLTLMDAGDRPRSTPIQVGTDRGVLRRMSDCVPAPEEAFVVPPRIAAAIGGISDVRAADPLGQHTLAARLRQLGSQPALAREAEATLRGLERWQEQTRHSYAAYAGAKLAQGLIYTSQEVSHLMQQTAVGAAVDTSNQHTQARQKKIAAWMRAILFSFVGLVIVLAVLTGVGVLTWWGALSGAGAGLVVWLLGSFVLFVQGQRDLFRDLNRRRAALSQVEADQANLRTAVRDLHRQTEAYGQFLEWTRVLGVLLHAPFGDATRSTPDSGTIEAGLPLNTRVGRAEVDAEATAEVVALMRRDLYQPGWLSQPWQATLADAGARLGTGAHDISAEPRRMFAQSAGVNESLLTAWADELEQSGVGTAAGEQLWQQALQRLGQPDYRSRLVTRVVVPGRDGGPATILSEQEFMAGVGEQRPDGKFDSGVLAREARLEGRDGVAQTWPLERFAGLNRQAVLVEVGEGLPDYTFDLGERIGAPTAPAADRSLIPPDPFADRPSDPSAGRPVMPRPPASAPHSGWVF